MPKFTIDGIEIEANEGQTVLQAALEHGIEIPHLCYHPKLKISGNCRMCLVEIEKVPKLQIACGTEVRDGMVVSTTSEKVVNARRAVMEFLLLHHPLDCPICDQSGECRLQDYAFEYGRDKSRYKEEKHTFARIDVGADIKRDMNRCIHCTRCIRFLRDVAGSEELALYERGGHTQVGPYLEKPIDSPFSANLAFVCPVGALTNKHFRFKGRSWLMDQNQTICVACARGCNVTAWSHKQKLLRFTPLENNSINRSWICNQSQKAIDAVNSESRISQGSYAGQEIDPDSGLAKAADQLRSLIDSKQNDAIAVIASNKLTNEDNYLIGKLAREVIGTKNLAFDNTSAEEGPFGPLDTPLKEWFTLKDKTPNNRGAAEALADFEPQSDIKEIVKAAGAGSLKALLVFSHDLVEDFEEPEKVIAVLKNVDFLMVVDSHRTKTTDLAKLVIAEASFAEKSGSYTNPAGITQYTEPVIEPLGDSRSAWQTAQVLANQLGADWNYADLQEIQDELIDRVERPQSEETDQTTLQTDTTT
jgi:NADH-quinone oxidoreductase subunit G